MEEESSGRSKGRRRHVDSDLPIPSLSKAYENRRTGGALGKSTGNHAGKDADIIGASSFFCPPCKPRLTCCRRCGLKCGFFLDLVDSCAPVSSATAPISQPRSAGLSSFDSLATFMKWTLSNRRFSLRISWMECPDTTAGIKEHGNEVRLILCRRFYKVELRQHCRELSRSTFL